ncbi:putative lipoprotein [Labilithrix luteola]|uniref:Putative lipoprotein n=1 Tax=Labilithrix luteola TaxID=1391654 RepID=A0A0K1Q612_9BACT|nr:FG-GAP-like repeat-containing protein [Labilithrix luteola]AKV01251.1 putative lipoprotein [Labilithrix luteola]
MKPGIRTLSSVAPLGLLLLSTSHCTSDAATNATTEPVEREPPATIPTSPDGFERLCQGRDWTAERTQVVLGAEGTRHSSVSRPSSTKLYPRGTQDAIKIRPSAPLLVEKLRVAFAQGQGPARLRLTTTIGRTNPSSYPDKDTPASGDFSADAVDLLPPIEFDVQSPNPDNWLEFDVSDAALTLLPTQHYALVYEHLDSSVLLSVEVNRSRGTSMSFVPGQFLPVGVAGNFRLQVVGESFCEWSPEERWFSRETSAPFALLDSPRAFVADIDGDRHDDVVLVEGGWGSAGVTAAAGRGLIAFLGNGHGAFSEAPAGTFPDVPSVKRASVVALADFDNDGDQDVFVAPFLNGDQDGDGYNVGDAVNPDCDDTNAKVHPGATEIASNGVDDDCDGIADDGASTSDADGDGYSIAKGDCDDTRSDVHPGASEILDGRDNDCNGRVDDVFGNRVLLNDGHGRYQALAEAGVESVGAPSAIDVADVDGDGVLDVFLGRWFDVYGYANRIETSLFYAGKGGGRFEEAHERFGLGVAQPRAAYGAVFNDFDEDGAPDLLVGNYLQAPVQFWKNRNGHFEDVAAALGVDANHSIKKPNPQNPAGHAYGADFGDLDGDGDIDFFLTNLAHPRERPFSDASMLYMNSGAPKFTFLDQRVPSGIIFNEGDVNVAFGDIDNDMDLDVLVVSSYGTHYSRLYANDGHGHFTDVTYEANADIENAVAGVFADFDEDGKLDILLTDRNLQEQDRSFYEKTPHVSVLRNRFPSDNAWVEFTLEGTTSNRDAIGAWVTLTAGGVTQKRWVRGAGGGLGAQQGSRVVHFGLGQNRSVDAISVRWTHGATETISGVEPLHRYRVQQGSGKAVPLN